jgi:outer membrane protein OmpA-like peptidoglycan-associated protein
VRKIIKLCGAACATGALAGCSMLNAGAPTTGPSAGPPVEITQDVPPSVLLAVLNGAGFGPALSSLVNTTALPRETLAVLAAGTPPETVLSSASPLPPTVAAPGQPSSPGPGQTSYQAAKLASRLKQWRAEVTTARRTQAAEQQGALSSWLRGLGLPAKASRLADPPGPADGLVAESAAAASAMAGFAQEYGDVFGDRRVIVLYSDDLSGRPPAGELAGEVVFVVTRFLPTAAAASAAQANLLAAGAAQAAVIGPEVTSSQLSSLVSAALRQDGMRESVSAPVLFANDSSVLSPSAIADLSGILPRLREAGVTAVINGFASTPGTALSNYLLSYQRAAAVASFFESRGVPASSLIIVGHGATDLVASGSSSLNRRVVVVMQNPS